MHNEDKSSGYNGLLLWSTGWALTISSSIEARRINIVVLKVNIALPVAVVLPTISQSLVDWQLEFDKSKVNVLENLEKGDPLFDNSLLLCA